MAGIDIKEKESMSGRHSFVQAECHICKRTFANQKSLVCHVEAVHEKVDLAEIVVMLVSVREA